MSNHQTQERPGYPVTNVIFPLIESNRAKARSEFPSEYPEEFLCAFQAIQVVMGKMLAASDDELRHTFMPKALRVYPQTTLSELRASIELNLSQFKEITLRLEQLRKEANQPVVEKNVTTTFTTQPTKFPLVCTYDEKVYIPRKYGWCQRDGSDQVDNSSEDGASIWQVAIDTVPRFYRCLMILIQADPKKLTQAELDILFAFELIDRRVILPQVERDLRIALKTPADLRTEQMRQMVDTFPEK